MLRSARPQGGEAEQKPDRSSQKEAYMMLRREEGFRYDLDDLCTSMLREETDGLGLSSWLWFNADRNINGC